MWYDLFSLFYDSALEELYVPYRETAVEAMSLEPGSVVLDVPCGTGQSLQALLSAVGTTGTVIGLDKSHGMLRKARKRSQKSGWNNVRFHRADVTKLGGEQTRPDSIPNNVDGVLCALGLTAFPDWQEVFNNLFSFLKPGGVFLLFDVYASQRSRETRMVETVAQADLSREAWLPLQSASDNFSRTVLPSDPGKLGGELYIAVGNRPTSQQPPVE